MRSLFLFLLLSQGALSFRSNTGLREIHGRLRLLLLSLRSTVPAGVLLKSTTEFLHLSGELESDLEACWLNLRGSLNFAEKGPFEAHQRSCLNSLLNYFSLFEILRSVVSKFLINTCPEELIHYCEPTMSRFKELASEVEAAVKKIVEALIVSDESFKSLEVSMAELQNDHIKRVVMNSILILNKENFYAQLDQILKTENEGISASEIDLAPEKPPTVSKSTLASHAKFEASPMLDDPFLNPDKFLLLPEPKEKLSDLHLVFTSEDSSSDLLK